ncbi:hypothetical protein [Pseudomonas savastanoi]|uniref:hypothetical protein n=1 Tax=Pseudomonas savastanoi TaxID=29438 RepID=UPI001EDB5F32|nr:hypothetical protein [Pseudomonas savastanoi]UKL12733.1 hypothetical protein HQ966_19065 [Pseudomonas savastanoi pv. savastanoi]
MNKTLSVLNAAALVALVAFHFHDSGASDTQVTAPAPVHHQISHALNRPGFLGDPFV